MNKNKQLTNNEIANFSQQIALILHAGISPYEGIAIMNEEHENNELKEPLTKIYESLDQGKSFYDSLKEADSFPEYMLNMVHIGEVAGRLEEVMDALGTHYERQYENSENIRSAISYPLIMIVMMVAVVVVLITQVLPIFNKVYEQLGSSITGFSLAILRVGQAMTNYSYIFVAILLLLAIGYFYFTKAEKGRAQFYDFLTKARFSRGISLKIALSQFTSGMAIALSSGLDIDESLEMSRSLVTHKGLSKRIEKAQEIMKEKDIAQGLVEAQVLTGMYARLIKLGYKTGGMDNIFRKIADQYDQETNESIQHMIGIIEPTLVAILSVLVGIILLSVMLPLIGIMSSL